MLRQQGHDFTADAVEHSEVDWSASDVVFRAPEDLRFGLESEIQLLNRLSEQLLGRRIRIRVTLPDTTNQGRIVSASGDGAPGSRGKPPAASGAEQRAMAHQQVQQFLNTFGGQVREVRDLKEK
jgi:hypothetical protein